MCSIDLAGRLKLVIYIQILEKLLTNLLTDGIDIICNTLYYGTFEFHACPKYVHLEMTYQ